MTALTGKSDEYIENISETEKKKVVKDEIDNARIEMDSLFSLLSNQIEEDTRAGRKPFLDKKKLKKLKKMAKNRLKEINFEDVKAIEHYKKKKNLNIE